jgi:hypothetical protein
LLDFAFAEVPKRRLDNKKANKKCNQHLKQAEHHDPTVLVTNHLVVERDNNNYDRVNKAEDRGHVVLPLFGQELSHVNIADRVNQGSESSFHEQGKVAERPVISHHHAQEDQALAENTDFEQKVPPIPVGHHGHGHTCDCACKERELAEEGQLQLTRTD